MESELSDFNAESYGRPPQIDFFQVSFLLNSFTTRKVLKAVVNRVIKKVKDLKGKFKIL